MGCAAGANAKLHVLASRCRRKAQGPDPGSFQTGYLLDDNSKCLACGGVGCGICELADNRWASQLEGLGDDALLCCFFPVREEAVEALCVSAEVRAALSKPGALFVDLGCGDGRVVLEVVSRFSCEGLGVELDHELVAAAMFAAQQNLTPETRARVTFRREDFRCTGLGGADVVFLFLPMHVCEFVLRKVLPDSSIRAGTLVVVCGRNGWQSKMEVNSANPGCRRVATYLTISGSHGTLHCFKWRR